MGTWTAIEVPESRQRIYATVGDEHSFMLEYLVTWEPANSSDTFPGDQQLPSQVPQIAARLPSAIRGTDPVLKRFVCRNVEFTPVRERPYTWRAALRYGTYETGFDLNFASLTRTTQIRTTPVWRLPDGFSSGSFSWSGFFPANGDQTWPPTTTIVGEPVDMVGQPRSYEIAQQQVVFEYLYDRTTASPVGEPPTQTWSTYVNYRNVQDWFGFPRGTLRYVGFQIAPANEYYRIQHTFIYDTWYHLEQFMAPVPSGAPICTSGITILGVVTLQADKVGWFQPYPRLPAGASFSDLVPATALGAITTPFPAAV